MAYLGIDQSLTATGLCVLNRDGTVAHLETVDPGKLRGAARLFLIKETLKRVINSAEMAFVVYEGYAYDAVGRVFQLGEVGGVVQLTVFEAGLEAISVAPVALKKFATGYVTADKDTMVLAAQRAGALAADDNQADAFFLARIALCLHTGQQPRTRAQIEVIHTLKNPKIKTTRRVRKIVKHAL